MSAPPPPEIRATWKLVIIVEPNEKLPGSTSVACWLVELVKVSVLNLTSGVVAGGNPAPKLDPLLELGPGLSPQPTELPFYCEQSFPKANRRSNSGQLRAGCGGRAANMNTCCSMSAICE